jgi:hypothetical protein
MEIRHQKYEEQLKKIAEELGGQYHHQLVLDRFGVESRRIVITYPDNK